MLACIWSKFQIKYVQICILYSVSGFQIRPPKRMLYMEGFSWAPNRCLDTELRLVCIGIHYCIGQESAIMALKGIFWENGIFSVNFFAHT